MTNDLHLLSFNALEQLKEDEEEALDIEFNNHQIRNQQLNEILEGKWSGRFSGNNFNSLNTGATWFTQISIKKNFNFFKKITKEESDQKYYRYMQKYAESMTASKHCHHKIIIGLTSTVKNTSSHDKYNNLKDSFETEEIRKADQRTIEYFKSILNKLELSDIIVKIDSWIEQSNGHSQLYTLLLRKLKLKYLQQQDFKLQKNKALLCNLIKEIIESHREILEKNELIEYLKQLESNGFKETAKILNTNQTSPNIRDESSFNKEIYLQLKYNGDKLKRTLNSCADRRVKFKPDDWQVRLLNVVDRDDSALVCCPTSSGKTFICYYAMEKILRSPNLNDMIVFISPNKALGNQVCAEIYARFGDRKYPSGIYKTVYAMYMPDYQINDPYKCQILVTIPTMFETLICTEINNEWLKNIKYVIIDEMQTINEIDLGVSIEKIIHFLDCPILGLSATMSNFDDFYNWFNSIESLKNKRRVDKISHFERYCDLQRFLFLPNANVSEAAEKFQSKRISFGLPKRDDDMASLVPVHEMLPYSENYLKKCDFARDFHLLPAEIASVLDSLQIILDENNENQTALIHAAFPDEFFTTILINKKDVKDYEKFLMSNFRNWIIDGVFTTEQLKRLYFLLNGKCEVAFMILKKYYGSRMSTDEWAIENIFELVENLAKNKMLPAIVFTESYRFADTLIGPSITGHYYTATKYPTHFNHN